MWLTQPNGPAQKEGAEHTAERVSADAGGGWQSVAQETSESGGWGVEGHRYDV